MWLLLIGIAGVLVFSCYTIFRFSVVDFQVDYEFRERSTPISLETKQDICNKFNIPDNDTRCDPDRVVYGVKFRDEIYDYFEENQPSYAELSEVLGPHEVFCEPPEDDDPQMICWYDLSGDDLFAIYVRFEPDGTYIYGGFDIWGDH